MEKDYRVCDECYQRLGLKITSDIESRCHRKYCDLCGFSSDSDLSSIPKYKIDGVEPVNDIPPFVSKAYSGLDADKDEVKALIGKRVEFSDDTFEWHNGVLLNILHAKSRPFNSG